jgi:pyruvate/2-oxoglutarate dehydrogenase complex dihydrolipoamide dehydrogenase (E3) component
VLHERNVLRAVSMQTWDALVVGSGQSGVPLAVELARANRRTAIVERADVGGTCINVGCTPTKTLVASARVASLAGRAAQYGLEPLVPRARWPEVREREQAVVRQFRAGGERRLRDAGVALLRGEARFVGPRRLRVSARDGTLEEHSAPVVVLNTGGRPRRPKLEGLDSVGALDSSTILTAAEFPSRLLILGGGHIALELGQVFRRLGAEVSVVETGPGWRRGRTRRSPAAWRRSSATRASPSASAAGRCAPLARRRASGWSSRVARCSRGRIFSWRWAARPTPMRWTVRPEASR